MDRKYLIIFLFIMSVFPSCTLIGLTIGINSDSVNKNSAVLPKFHSSEFDIGDDVIITLSNRDTIAGQIVGFDTVRSAKIISRHNVYGMADQKDKSIGSNDSVKKKNENWRLKYIILSGKTEHAIDIIDIAHIGEDKQYYGWLVGTLIGAGLDIAFIYIINSSISPDTGLNFGN